MAYSYLAVTGNGATTDYVLPFPYLEKSHVTVTVNGVNTAFEWLNFNSVRINPPPANGSAVRIQRNSNRHARLSNYQDAQVLTEAQLDYDAQQNFYVAQEAFDAVADAPTGGDMRRSMNLSDVYDINQARANIQALATTGGTMTGPLYLTGNPSVPNQAVNKAYVDQIVGITGVVNSFNTRTGAVVLNGTDVTVALGFLPVSKSGDTMAGPLLLAGDPTTPLGAATKQYVDAHAGGGNTGEYVFPAASPTTAAMRLNKTQTSNTSDRAGSANILIERTGGNVPMVAWMHTYKVTSNFAVGEVGDIGLGSLMIGRAATFLGGWFAAVGPRTNPGQGWAPVGLKVNAVERVADQGFRESRTGGSYSMGIQVSPDKSLNVGDGPPVGYNGTFGIGFIASGGESTASRWWTPIYIEQNSIVAGGVGINIRGGSDAYMGADYGITIKDHFLKGGIDFRNATFADADNTAVWLAQGQCIHLGAFARIYQSPAGDFVMYDPIAGSKTLSQLAAGGGVVFNTNNSWTGKNQFTKTTTPMAFGNYGYSVQMQSLGNGALTASDIILDWGYQTSVDIRKTTSVAAEQVTMGGNSAMYLQHSATGAMSGQGVVVGLRCQMETTQSNANPGALNDVVSGYFGLANSGTNSSGFGIHADVYHKVQAGSAAGNSYGMSVELFRDSLIGNTVGYMARTIGGGSYKDNTVAFLAAPGGDGSRKFVTAFAAGNPLAGSLNCDFGLDLLYASCNTHAIRIPQSKTVSWSNDTLVTQRFDAANNVMKFTNNGVDRLGIDIRAATPGLIYQFDHGTGTLGPTYINTGGIGGAVLSVRSGNRTSGPSNPSAIANWLRVDVDGVVYYWPLYR